MNMPQSLEFPCCGMPFISRHTQPLQSTDSVLESLRKEWARVSSCKDFQLCSRSDPNSLEVPRQALPDRSGHRSIHTIVVAEFPSMEIDFQ